MCLDVSASAARRPSPWGAVMATEPTAGASSSGWWDNESSYRVLVDTIEDYGILILDPDGIVRTWNPGAQRIKGYTADEIIGQSFEAFYPREQREAGFPARELEEARANGRFEDEGWRVRKDGSQFWGNVVITALHDGNGVQLQPAGKLPRPCDVRLYVLCRLHGCCSMQLRCNGYAERRYLYLPDGVLPELRSPVPPRHGW